MTRWFTGTRARILVSEPTHSLVEAEALRGDMPPLHVHSRDDETFYCLEGRLSLITAEETVEIGPGEAAFARRGVPHVYRVESERARWLVSTTDNGFATFVQAASVPAEHDGFASPEQLPQPALLGALAAERGVEILGPPGALPA